MRARNPNLVEDIRVSASKICNDQASLSYTLRNVIHNYIRAEHIISPLCSKTATINKDGFDKVFVDYVQRFNCKWHYNEAQIFFFLNHPRWFRCSVIGPTLKDFYSFL